MWPNDKPRESGVVWLPSNLPLNNYLMAQGRRVLNGHFSHIAHFSKDLKHVISIVRDGDQIQIETYPLSS